LRDEKRWVRDVQKRLKSAGGKFVSLANVHNNGPASCVVLDPDGNLVLPYQHV
jgi:hypothetical protein